MKHLNNSSVETWHCSLGEKVQAHSRIHRAGEKKALKSLNYNSQGSVGMKITFQIKYVSFPQVLRKKSIFFSYFFIGMLYKLRIKLCNVLHYEAELY